MIDTKDFAFPKPGHKEGLVKLSAYQYRKHRERVWQKQSKRCAKCRRPITDLSDGHLHHYDGRGMGGGKRNDWKTEFLCIECHLKEHNQ